MEIPRTIHYCWFGRGPLPDYARKCIASWRNYFPGYEIIEWNEDNFDIGIHPYVRSAYDAGKYAFASDYARFWILYNHGGIYFDTDVEAIRHFAGIENTPFMGIEQNGGTSAGVAPGLGIGAYPKMDIFREMLEEYAGAVFETGNGVPETVVEKATRVLLRHGFNSKDEKQEVSGVQIYPSDVFCPLDHATGILTKTERTVSIHHYAASWLDHRTLEFRLYRMKCFMIKIFGKRFVMSLAERLVKARRRRQ